MRRPTTLRPSLAAHLGGSHTNTGGGGVGYTGPLDLLTGFVAAYGQRALSSALRGTPLYTIDGVGFNSDASTGAANGAPGSVTNWVDQSGNTANMLGVDGAATPVWQANVLNSIPAFQFDSGEDLTPVLLATASGVLVPASGVTAFICMKPIANSIGGGFSIIGGGNVNGPGWDVGTNSTTANPTGIILDNYSGDTDETGGHTASNLTIYGAPHILDVQIATGTLNAFLDGAAAPITSTRGNGIATDVSPQFVIGCDDVALPDNNFFNGYMFEVLLHPTLIGTSTRDAIRQNIADYYGITLS